jgi:glycosyltransferase involved in cell wall biosynthesis
MSDSHTTPTTIARTLSIIVPVYNEEAVIEAVAREILDRLGEQDELLVVDDGSTDRTAELALKAGARVVSHPYNMGNGAAVKTGIRNGRGDVFVFMDGDGQHDPGEIHDLAGLIGAYDMVVGARAGFDGAMHRNLANGIYNFFASYITGRKIADLTSGFRAIKAGVARKFAYLLPNTFSYPTTITLALMRAGRSVKYHPITVSPRVGRSKIRLFTDGPRFFIIIFRIAVLFSPLRIFIPVSAAVFLAGLLYYAYTFFTSHRFTNFSQLMMVASILFFLLGLISEQIALLRFDRSDDQPEP